MIFNPEDVYPNMGSASGVKVTKPWTFLGGMNGTLIGKTGKIYYVDEENGSSGNDGLTPETAFDTILAATALCRDDYSDDAQYFIYIFPGTYTETDDLRLYGHGMHLIGIGQPGADSGVNILATNCTNGCILLAGANCSIENIEFRCDIDVPGIFVIASDNSIISNCTFKGTSGTTTNAILVDDMRTSIIEGCTFGEAGGDFERGIFCESGADKYLIDSRITNNKMYADGAAAMGIRVHADVVTYGTVIDRNFINLGKATGASIGIDNNASGVIMICDNYVCMASGDTPIESASSPTGMIGNHTLAGSTTVDPNEAP